MSIRLITVDVDPERGVMLQFDRTSLTMQTCQTASFSFSSFPLTEAHVQYNLVTCTMYDVISCSSFVRYYLAFVRCTISISEPLLLQYLVLGELRSLLT